MNHLIVAPLLLPLLMGAIIVIGVNRSLSLHRTLGLLSSLAITLITGTLLYQAMTGPIQMYVLGDWTPPFGIIMVLDRLSAMMIFITSLLAFLCLLYAVKGTDEQGKNFHALFQFQLLGINGAFLTGDIFNLFVFFEVMLLSSYGLVLHGGGARRTKAGMHYVMLNLVGSSIFLIGVGILYGLLGSLNMADLAVRIAHAPADNAALLQAGGLILFGVFALKAALLPLYFWLPNAYGFTSAPVAALFAVMTKVGVYVILRVYTLIFGEHAGVAAHLLAPWLLPVALFTLAAGSIGVVASRDLRRTIAYMVVVSVGTLLAVIGTFDTDAIAAAIMYLPHTTFMTAAMFLIADMISRQRLDAGAGLTPDRPVGQQRLLGLLFLGAAVAIGGLPPLSGFTAKVMMLMGVQQHAAAPWIWSLVLTGGLFGLIALGRAGSVIFWKTLPLDEGGAGAYAKSPHPGIPHYAAGAAAPALLLLAISPLLVLFGGPLSDFAHAVAGQISNPVQYIEAVLGSDAVASLLASGGGH
ncbi:MAG: monovalent cation/H+ antiporter subunit D [Pelovirga sp.]